MQPIYCRLFLDGNLLSEGVERFTPEFTNNNPEVTAMLKIKDTDSKVVKVERVVPYNNGNVGAVTFYCKS